MTAPGTDAPDRFSVRPMADDDGPAFSRFVSQVPEGERRFLKENLERPG